MEETIDQFDTEDFETTIPMQAIVEQTYDPVLIENIKRILEMQVQEGKPQGFEIDMDGLRVVSRTIHTEKFDNYKKFLHPTFKKITVTVYKGIKTPNGTKHVFIKDKPQENLGSIEPVRAATLIPEYLQGITYESRTKELMDMRDLQNDNKWLQRKIEKRDTRIKEAEDYISKLQAGIEHLKTEAGNKQNVWVDRLLKIAESPPDWVKLMVLNSTKSKQQLSGTESTDDQKTESLSESDQQRILILRRMEEELEENQLEAVMLINEKFVEEPGLIPQVAGILDITPV